VTCRAKERKSLLEKLIMRNDERIRTKLGAYQNTDQIWDDVVDLAGVRVVLYMPSDEQKEKVEKVIQSIWGAHVRPKLHDGSHAETNSSSNGEEHGKRRTPRHLGYHAKHYRVSMKEEHSNPGSYEWQSRDKVEIQVRKLYWRQVGRLRGWQPVGLLPLQPDYLIPRRFYARSTC
jgi:ppGpp synthetase/RelA/SpoT-type nucleotidyltranferase